MKPKNNYRRWQNNWGFAFETSAAAKKAFRLIKSWYWPNSEDSVKLEADIMLFVATREIAREVKGILDLDGFKYTLSLPLH